MRNLGLTTALILLAFPRFGVTSAETLLTPADSESKILVAVLGSSKSPAESASSDWNVDSGQTRIQVVRSKRLGNEPDVLIVVDAARLEPDDYISIRSTLTDPLPGLGSQLAWADDQGWAWRSPETLPEQLPQYSKRPQDSFEAAVFLNWIREIITAARKDEAPIQIALFTRDFAVSEFASESVATAGTERTLPRQCLDSVVSLLTGQPTCLTVVNFSPKPGYLSSLAKATGGIVTRTPNEFRAIDPERTYILTLLTSFRESEDTLPVLPTHPIQIQVWNQDPAWKIRAPEVLWPLPAGLQPPTLSELMEAQQLRTRVDSLRTVSDPIQALVLARKIVELSPFNLSDRIRILELLRSIGNPDPVELERSADEALTLFPNSPELCSQKALAAEEGGRIDEAIRWYETALASDSNQSDLCLQVADLYMETGQWEKSVDCLGTVVGTELDSAIVRLNYAKSLQAIGSSEEAWAQLGVAREMNPGSLRVLELEMRFALDSKDYSQALVLAENVLESHPNQPTANFAAGLALTRLQRYDDAIPYLQVADASHFRDDFELQRAFYECLNAQGRLEKAAQHLERAAALKPRAPGIWMDLAVLHERRGDRLGASEALKRGATENKEDIGFQLSLSEWLERHGDGSEALASLEKALEMASDQERTEIAQRYVLLKLQEAGSSSGLLDINSRLDPELDRELLRAVQKGTEIRTRERSIPTGLVLPGGLEPLLTFAPFLSGRVQDGDFLDLLFGYLLETEPLEFASQKVVETNPRREETVIFYQEFLRFEKWLRREIGSTAIRQPITTDEGDLEAVNRILTYFGVKVRRFKFSRPTYTPDPESVPKLEVIVEPRYEKRRTILKWFGLSTNLIGEGSVLEFELKEATIPVQLGIEYWNQNIFGLDGDRRDELLLQWLKNPQAMKLYRALVKLPAPARLHFVNILTADQLLKDITPGLLSMGALLKFDNQGRIVLPGGEGANQLWNQLVQTPVENEAEFLKELFTRDEGRVLYYLASLSGQRPAVLDFLLSDAERFKTFYGYLRPPPKGNFLAGRPARFFHDMADLLSILRTDGKKVYFPASWRQSSAASSREGFRFEGNEELVRALFQTEESGLISNEARKYAMLEALELNRSPLLSGAPERLLDLGALYGLVADLGLDASLAETMLNQIDSIERESLKSDRRTVVALFQAPLVIMRILANNQVFEREEIDNLAGRLLSPSRVSWLPGDVALHVSGILAEMTRLLETRYGPAQPLDLLLKAFTARHNPISFVWDGETRIIDLATRDIEQMHASLEEHYVAPLDSVLQAFDQLGRVSDDPEVVVDKISAAVDPLLNSNASLDYLTEQYRQAIEHTNGDRLKAALAKFQAALLSSDLDQQRETRQILTGELAPYLAEALIALVYVRYLKANDLVVQTDEHFFRKHDFEEKAFRLGSHGPQSMGGSWGQPILVKDKILGSKVVGSLAGISRPLARLKAEQLQARSTTRFADSTFPVTQKLAVELVDPLRVTNGSLVCVGRTLDLARKILAASVIDQTLQSFVFATLENLCGSGRYWQIRPNLLEGNLSSALDLMLPSELYLLGREYWVSQSGTVATATPVESDLAWFFQDNPGCTWHYTHPSESPTRELGFPLTTSVGVDLLFLGHSGSIEESATYSSPHRLAERSCQLKIRMAELFWRMGLPSPLFKIVCDRVLDRILPKVGQVDREDWRAVTLELQRISEVDVDAVLSDLFDE